MLFAIFVSQDALFSQYEWDYKVCSDAHVHQLVGF